MSTKCVVNKSTLTGIANAIRAKDGSTDTMLPSAMAAKIEAIPTGGGDPYRDAYLWSPPKDWPNLRKIAAEMSPADYGFPSSYDKVIVWLSFSQSNSVTVKYKYSVCSDGFVNTVDNTTHEWSSPADTLSDGTGYRWVATFFDDDTTLMNIVGQFTKGYVAWIVSTGNLFVPYAAQLNEQSYLNAIEAPEITLDSSGLQYLACYSLKYLRFNVMRPSNETKTNCCNRIFEADASLTYFERYDSSVDECKIVTGTGAVSLFNGCSSLCRMPYIDASTANSTFVLGGGMYGITKPPKKFDLRSATSINFGNLKNILSLPSDIKANVSFSFAQSVNVSDKGSVAEFDESGNVVGGMVGNINTCTASGQTVTLNSSIKAMFTEAEQTAISSSLTDKNWTLVW